MFLHPVFHVSGQFFADVRIILFFEGKVQEKREEKW